MSNPTLRIAASGMQAMNLKVQTISNNLANVNTTGYKRSSSHFADLLYQRIEGARMQTAPGDQAGPALQLGRGVRLVGNAKIHTQGSLEITNSQLDLALDGQGFFVLERPDGTQAYTRDGNLTRTAGGNLVSASGYELAPGIVIPAEVTEIDISADGSILGQIPGQEEPVDLGRLEIARFANPAGLVSLGQNLYEGSPAAGDAFVGYPGEDGMARVIQGALETSNVDIVQEMVEMIAAQRAFETASKGVTAADRMMEQTNTLVR